MQGIWKDTILILPGQVKGVLQVSRRKKQIYNIHAGNKHSHLTWNLKLWIQFKHLLFSSLTKITNISLKYAPISGCSLTLLCFCYCPSTSTSYKTLNHRHPKAKMTAASVWWMAAPGIRPGLSRILFSSALWKAGEVISTSGASPFAHLPWFWQCWPL